MKFSFEAIFYNKDLLGYVFIDVHIYFVCLIIIQKSEQKQNFLNYN